MFPLLFFTLIFSWGLTLNFLFWVRGLLAKDVTIFNMFLLDDYIVHQFNSEQQHSVRLRINLRLKSNSNSRLFGRFLRKVLTTKKWFGGRDNGEKRSLQRSLFFGFFVSWIVWKNKQVKVLFKALVRGQKLIEKNNLGAGNANTSATRYVLGYYTLYRPFTFRSKLDINMLFHYNISYYNTLKTKEKLFVFVLLSFFITLISLGAQIQGAQTRYIPLPILASINPWWEEGRSKYLYTIRKYLLKCMGGICMKVS